MNVLIRDRRGAAYLLFLPLLLLLTVFTVEYTRATTVSDINVQDTLAFAAKSACMAVSPVSQANGTPRIQCDAGYNNFKNLLQKDLGLDSNMNPLPGSPLKSRPDFMLIIYNGDNTYAGDGADGGKKYSYIGGTLSTSSLVATGFPSTFSIAPLHGGSSAFTVTLDSPGAIAVINAQGTQITSADNLNTDRWTAAKIVMAPSQ